MERLGAGRGVWGAPRGRRKGDGIGWAVQSGVCGATWRMQRGGVVWSMGAGSITHALIK